MTLKEILERANFVKNTLERKDISTILARYPDIDWSVDFNPYTVSKQLRINGDLNLTNECKELELDITTIANCVDANNWNYLNIQTLFEAEEVCIRIYISIFQPLEKEEKELLRALGKLRRIHPETHSYETIVCES